MNIHEKKFISEIDEIILNDATRIDTGFLLNFEDLDVIKKSKLVALYIEYKGRELINDSINDNFYSFLLNFMKNLSLFTCEDLKDQYENISWSAVICCENLCKESIQKIILEHCEILEKAGMYDLGYEKKLDGTTGEYQWQR